MNFEQLRAQIEELYEAIRILRSDRKYMPALILTYSLIDILAWLDRPIEHEDVIREDFQHWVENYLRPEVNLGCTSRELYAARCGIVHSYNSQSRLSREDNVAELFYSILPGTKDKLKSLIARFGPDRNAKAISFDELIEVLYEGLSLFLVKKGSDPLILGRARLFFRFLPESSADNF